MKKFLIFILILLIASIIWSMISLQEYQETIDRVDAKIGKEYAE